MKSVKDEGLITQLAVVATMMPKVKEYIDQQADRIAELEKFNKAILKKGGYPHKPLSDEEISQVYKEISEPFGEKRLYEIHDFARAIEERHGIK